MFGFNQDEKGNFSYSRPIAPTTFGIVLATWAAVSIRSGVMADIPPGVIQIVLAAVSLYAGVKAVSVGLSKPEEKKEDKPNVEN